MGGQRGISCKCVAVLCAQQATAASGGAGADCLEDISYSVRSQARRQRHKLGIQIIIR